MESSTSLQESVIEQRILLIRSLRVMLDSDLALIYGVSTKRLNEQVRRNLQRFPEGFMFRLTRIEKAKVVAKCDHLRHLRFSPYLPYAFTEHGTIMLACVLNSSVAIRASVEVVRVFVRLREILSSHKDIVTRLDKIERRYNAKFRVVFDAIRELMESPKESPKKIGFLID